MPLVIENQFILKIKKTKNNCFIMLTDLNGKLIVYKSLNKKNIKDIKVRFTWGIMHFLKKLQILKIKFILLYVENLAIKLIKDLFTLFKIWDMNIVFFNYVVPLPHNGCRLSKKPRKRNKGRSKSNLGL